MSLNKKPPNAEAATICSDDNRCLVGNLCICGHASHASDVWPIHKNAPEIEGHGTLATHVQHVRVGAVRCHLPRNDALRSVAPDKKASPNLDAVSKLP